MLEFVQVKEKRKPEQTIIKYRLDSGTMAGREFYGHMLICSGPTCCCNTVHLNLISSEKKEAFSISLDVEKRTFHEDVSKGAANQLFAERVAAELTDSEWNDLRTAYILHKEDATEESDLSDVKPNFPEYPEGNAVYDVREVLPHAAPFRLRDDKGEIQAFDSYCCVPQCSCRDSFVGFVRPSTSKSIKENFTEIRLSYFSKKIEEVMHISVYTSLPPCDVGAGISRYLDAAAETPRADEEIISAVYS